MQSQRDATNRSVRWCAAEGQSLSVLLLYRANVLMHRRMSSLLLFYSVFCCAMAGGVVIDRIAVIVDKHAIKASDVERDLRVTQFLNRERLDLSVDAKRKSAERLIDQSIIRDEILKGAYAGTGTGDVDAMLKRLRQDR